jgi:hypothetical protein
MNHVIDMIKEIECFGIFRKGELVWIKGNPLITQTEKEAKKNRAFKETVRKINIQYHEWD